jgi:hypothetical protein
MPEQGARNLSVFDVHVSGTELPMEMEAVGCVREIKIMCNRTSRFGTRTEIQLRRALPLISFHFEFTRQSF